MKCLHQDPSSHGHCQICLCPLSFKLPGVIYTYPLLFYTLMLLVSDFSPIAVLELLSLGPPVTLRTTTVHGHSSVPAFQKSWTSLPPWLLLMLQCPGYFSLSLTFGSLYTLNNILYALPAPQSKSKCWVLTSLYVKSRFPSKFQTHLSNLLLDSSTLHPKLNPSQSEFATIPTSCFLFHILCLTWGHHCLDSSCQLQVQELGIPNPTPDTKFYPFCDLSIS